MFGLKKFSHSTVKGTKILKINPYSEINNSENKQIPDIKTQNNSPKNQNREVPQSHKNFLQFKKKINPKAIIQEPQRETQF